jgi:WD40 repeat protein
LWRAFQRSDECDGYRQAFLKGHKYAIGVIEVCILIYLFIYLFWQYSSVQSLLKTTEKETYMVTGETNVVNPMIILWDLSEGKRLASLRPHSTALCSAAFSPSGSMLVTVGLDSHHRIQISLWDVQTMIREKGTIIGYKSALAPGTQTIYLFKRKNIYSRFLRF